MRLSLHFIFKNNGLKLATLAWLAVLVFFSGCDPNNFDATRLDQIARRDALLPVTPRRVALLACERGLRPTVLAPGQQRIADPNLNPEAVLSPDSASFHILSIDTSLAYDTAAGRLGAENPVSGGLIRGTIVGRQTKFVGEDPFEVVFTPDGRTALASLLSGEIAVFAVEQNGVLQFIDILEGPQLLQPSHLAVSPRGDYAFVVNRGNNTIQAIDLTVKDALGRSLADLENTPFSASAANINQLGDIAVLYDRDRDIEVLAAAASQGGIYFFDVDVALGFHLPDPKNIRNVENPLAVFNGQVGQVSRFGTVANLLAVAPRGQLFWNSLIRGPETFDGAVAALQDRGIFTTPGLQFRVDGIGVRDLEVLPNGNVLAAMTSNRVAFFDIRTPFATPRAPVVIGGDNQDLVFDPDQEFGMVVSGGSRGTVTVFDLDTLGFSNERRSEVIRVDTHCRNPRAAAIRTQLNRTQDGRPIPPPNQQQQAPQQQPQPQVPEV